MARELFGLITSMRTGVVVVVVILASSPQTLFLTVLDKRPGSSGIEGRNSDLYVSVREILAGTRFTGSLSLYCISK